MSILLAPGAPLVIGHRGAAAILPENTLPSFAHALQLGVDAVEFDVRVSVDGVAVVHHDANALRTCGVEMVIEETTVDVLRSLNAAATFAVTNTPLSATPIPLLDEVLELTRGRDVIIECKTREAAPQVIAAVRRHGASTRVLIGSFVHAAMMTTRAASMPSGASRRDMLALYARHLMRLVPRRLPFAAMCIPETSGAIRLPLARFAEWGRRVGVPVHVWTVNDVPTAERLWDAGITGILSDDPALLLQARAARASRSR
jgi:glycerophosphoryl diester phosphodiesterase